MPTGTVNLNAEVQVRGDVRVYEQMRSDGWDSERVSRELPSLIQQADQQGIFLRLNFLRYMAQSYQSRVRFSSQDENVQAALERYFDTIGEVQDTLIQMNREWMDFYLVDTLESQRFRRFTNERDLVEAAAQSRLFNCMLEYDPTGEHGSFEEYREEAFEQRLYRDVREYSEGGERRGMPETFSFFIRDEGLQAEERLTQPTYDNASEVHMRAEQDLAQVIQHADLSQTENLILRLRYGLDGEPQSFRDIGRHLEKEPQEVEKIYGEAMAKVRQAAVERERPRIRPELVLDSVRAREQEAFDTVQELLRKGRLTNYQKIVLCLSQGWKNHLDLAWVDEDLRDSLSKALKDWNGRPMKNKDISRLFNRSIESIQGVRYDGYQNISRWVRKRIRGQAFDPLHALQSFLEREADPERAIRLLLEDTRLTPQRKAILCLSQGWKRHMDWSWLKEKSEQNFKGWIDGEKLTGAEIARRLGVGVATVNELRRKALGRVVNWIDKQEGETPIDSRGLQERRIYQRGYHTLDAIETEDQIAAMLQEAADLTPQRKAILCLSQGWKRHMDWSWVDEEARGNFADWKDGKRLTLTEIARGLGLSEQRVSELRQRAVETISAWKREKGDSSLMEPDEALLVLDEQALAQEAVETILQESKLTDLQKAIHCLLSGWREQFDEEWLPEHAKAEVHERLQNWQAGEKMTGTEVANLFNCQQSTICRHHQRSQKKICMWLRNKAC